MPIYEYSCEHCSHKFDKLVMSHNTDVKCPLCQGGVKKLMSTFSVGTADALLSSFLFLGAESVAGEKRKLICIFSLNAGRLNQEMVG
jgi:putative FmdB family regulatory protein